MGKVDFHPILPTFVLEILQAKNAEDKEHRKRVI